MADQTSEEIASERIEKAFRFRETELDLTGLTLENLPADIGGLTWLEKLDLESVG